MTQFAKHSLSMTIEQANAISKKPGSLFVFNFLQGHISPKYHVCFFDEELEAELLEKAKLSKAQLVAILRYFRSKNIIKAFTTFDGVPCYGINPELTGENNRQELYDSWVDSCRRNNSKATQEFKEKHSSKRENKGKEESNKSYHEEEDPKGDSKKTDPKESRLEKLKSLKYDRDYKDNPNTAQIRRAKSEFYVRTNKDSGSFDNVVYAVIRGMVVGRCDGQVEMPDVLAYDEKENKTYLQISGK